jgi:hypothetical protein
MTQGKIERYHRTMKNVVKLRNYDMPWELEEEICRFVQHYNHERVHEALDNLTPADVYEGRSWEIQSARGRCRQQRFARTAWWDDIARIVITTDQDRWCSLEDH